MMLKEERSTPHAVAFEILLPEQANSNKQLPEVAKRLEAESLKTHNVSLDDIQQKLQKAEEKRKLSFNQGNSPKFEERRNKALERKKSLEQEKEKHLMQDVERDLQKAEQLRLNKLD